MTEAFTIASGTCPAVAADYVYDADAHRLRRRSPDTTTTLCDGDTEMTNVSRLVSGPKRSSPLAKALDVIGTGPTDPSIEGNAGGAIAGSAAFSCDVVLAAACATDLGFSGEKHGGRVARGIDWAKFDLGRTLC
ncbi:MAG: hypothetical protein WAW88_02785 [Nocardioides sp.]